MFNINSVFCQEKISISDLGSTPNDGKSIIPALKLALQKCSTRDSSIMVFPKGRYDFWPDFTSNQATIGIPLDKLKNVTIEGGDSEFIYHGNMVIAGYWNVKM